MIMERNGCQSQGSRRPRLQHLRPHDAADAIAALTPTEQITAFENLPERPAAAVFEYLPRATQRALV